MRLFFVLFFFVALVATRPLPSEEEADRSVLFIMDRLQLGGSEQAFISLMNNWAIPHTKVEILLRAEGGVLLPRLRKDFAQVSAKEAFCRSYDAAVCFVEWLHPRTNLWMVHAPRKVQWIHIDLLAKPEDRPFKHAALCRGIDAFVCVSDKVAEIARTIQPQLSDKIVTIHNVLDGKLIRTKAMEKQHCFPHDGVCNVVTVGRLHKQKALDRAIKVHSRLDKEGINFRWYIVGEGAERGSLQRLIKEYGLENKFILLGQKMNPYPYIAQADLFALPSLWEGCSIVVNEAKVLGRPILMTEVAGAHEQIESGKNGLVVDNNEEAIYEGLKKLILDKKMRKKFSDALSGFVYENQPIYDQIERVLFPPYLCVYKQGHDEAHL